MNRNQGQLIKEFMKIVAVEMAGHYVQCEDNFCVRCERSDRMDEIYADWIASMNVDG